MHQAGGKTPDEQAPDPERRGQRPARAADDLVGDFHARGGVTGLAQVHGLREQHSSEDKARFDLQYIFNWSPLLDLSLILQTVWTLVFRGLNHQESHAIQATNVRSEPSGYVNQEAIDVNRS